MDKQERDKAEQQNETKTRFDWLFQQNRNYYEKQTKQDENLMDIVASLHIEKGKTVLDLGTGTGYIAFHIARTNPEVNVIGLDIIEKTLECNREQAKREGLKNLTFQNIDGVNLPLDDNSADVLVTRFALHHFVQVEKSFEEFSRVLKQGGQLFLVDPTPEEIDKEKLIDRFMQLVPDGHVTFYTREEFEQLGKKNGFALETCYMTDVFFPSNGRTEGYYEMEKRGEITPELKRAYDFQIVEDVVWSRIKVLNISFVRQ